MSIREAAFFAKCSLYRLDNDPNINSGPWDKKVLISITNIKNVLV
jgi:hypothetical protein